MPTATTLLSLALALALAGGPQSGQRKPNPFAPSLPELTEEEEDKLDKVIDRFIQQDLGQLRGEDAKKALADFTKLGPEAIPALIRGMNRAAAIESSCPAVLIAKKLHRMLMASEDPELMEFARENIGSGVGATRHASVLKDLRVACTLRKNALNRAGITAATPSLRSRSVGDLASLAGSERGQKLKQVLTELETRSGDQVIAALGTAAATYEDDVKQLARDLLVKHLSRQARNVVKEKFKDERPPVRAAAARVAGAKAPELGGDLIDLLADDDESVREAAHQALVKLNRGIDLGGGPKASKTEREEAVKKWREWWGRRGGR